MLNGLYPIIIFHFKKLLPSSLSFLTQGSNQIPLLAEVNNLFPLIPIPLYLDEKTFGLVIDSESKHIDIVTEVETLPDGKTPRVVQRGINSNITINMQASTGSIGLSVLLAMSDLVFSKVTSEEYGITYINKAVTVFNGKIDGLSVTQNANNSLYNISLSISKAQTNSTVAAVAPTAIEKVTGTLPDIPSSPI
jgi:hypothetical protein